MCMYQQQKRHHAEFLEASRVAAAFKVVVAMGACVGRFAAGVVGVIMRAVAGVVVAIQERVSNRYEYQGHGISDSHIHV
jgi:hypothetical protein